MTTIQCSVCGDLLNLDGDTIIMKIACPNCQPWNWLLPQGLLVKPLHRILEVSLITTIPRHVFNSIPNDYGNR